MVTKNICKPRKNTQNRLAFQDKCSVNVYDSGVHLSGRIKKKPICPILSEKFGYLRTNESKNSKELL